MLQDGIIKVLQGITSIDELRRVIDVDTPPEETAPEAKILAI